MTPLEPLLQRLGVPLSAQQCAQLLQHLSLLRAQHFSGLHLVSSSDLPRLLLRHTLDSLTALPLLPSLPDLRLLDLGSGGGFPGVPIQVARPDLNVDLLESSRPRALFLRTLPRMLHLPRLHVIHARAEHLPDLRPPYDLVLARAFAPLSRLLPLVTPLLRPAGLLIAYKGPAFRAELSSVPEPPLTLLRTRATALSSFPPTTLLVFQMPSTPVHPLPPSPDHTQTSSTSSVPRPP